MPKFPAGFKPLITGSLKFFKLRKLRMLEDYRLMMEKALIKTLPESQLLRDDKLAEKDQLKFRYDFEQYATSRFLELFPEKQLLLDKDFISFLKERDEYFSIDYTQNEPFLRLCLEDIKIELRDNSLFLKLFPNYEYMFPNRKPMLSPELKDLAENLDNLPIKKKRKVLDALKRDFMYLKVTKYKISPDNNRQYLYHKYFPKKIKFKITRKPDLPNN